jgi:hypothetical protein
MAAGSGEGIKNGQKMDFHADPKLACSFLRSRITSSRRPRRGRLFWVSAKPVAGFLRSAATNAVYECCGFYWVAIYGSGSMCDYSLHAVSNRPAEVADKLVSTKFPLTTTRGFASFDNPHVAVCLRPGTEIAFEEDVRVDGWVFRRRVNDRLARFRQIEVGQYHHHHDALEFSNGRIVLVTDLRPGQKAIVLQLPVSQVSGRPETTTATLRVARTVT